MRPRSQEVFFAWLVVFNHQGQASSSPLLSPSGSSLSPLSSSMLAFVGSSRTGRKGLLGSRALSPVLRDFPHTGCGSSSTAVGVRSRHASSSGSAGCWTSPATDWSRQHYPRDRRRTPLLSSLSVEERCLPRTQLWTAAHHARGTSRPPPHRSTRVGCRRSGGAAGSTEMAAAKSKGDTATRSHPEEESTMSSAEIAAGTRVRLRDTGRLGTVVGKAGGWWKVDLLEGWGAVGGGATTATAAAGSGAGKNATASGSSAASSGPVSTRRVNIEPLGNAYASPPPPSEAVPPVSPIAVAPPEVKAPASKRPRAAPASSKRSTRAAATTAEPTAAAAATPVADVGGEAARTKRTKATKKRTVAAAPTSAASTVVVPPSLVGQTISLQVPPPAATNSVDEKGQAATVTIGKMSAEGLAHDEMEEWLVFSDLHVSPGSLSVTLEALDRVNEEAMKRSACGIAFLGDFWHARGSLKVDLLVPVMKRLATWTRPVVMIPGNHDQVTLGGGVHSLTPLQFAFTDPKQALVLSEPTLFLDALWIPHRRNNADMEALLGSEEARGARAIFCHVDIKGAAMNDGVSSNSGIPRSAFPEGVPTFSGHFHKPHTVGRRDGFIRYVGSPYQTSLSESGQSKALIVLDAETWQERKEIPLDIGRRFFRVKGEDQRLPELGEASPGDRVVWTVKDAGSDEVRRRAEALQQEMVEVEIREAPRPFATFSPFSAGESNGSGESGPRAAGAAGAAAGNGEAVGGDASTFPDSASLSPEALFRAYLKREREGGGRNVSQEVEELGFSLIKDLGQQAPSSKEGGRKDRHTSLTLHSIQLKNFGPFRDEVTYPLDERGVVLLRGSNLDDSGADSNGAGKTTLAMSALWALAGVVDTRPVSDGRVADVVHEGSRALSPSSSSSSENGGTRDGGADGGGGGGARRSTVAEATLTGTLNGKPLWLKRRKGARVNQLFLEHDGQDLTRQIAKETQIVLEEDLGLSSHVLGRGIFQGQHHLNGLLESTDAQLKEDLALLVPMDMWQDLASRSRATARESDDDAARFRERAVTRREDLARLAEELERARAEAAAAASAATATATNTADAPEAPTSSSSSAAAPKASSISTGDSDLERVASARQQGIAPAAAAAASAAAKTASETVSSTQEGQKPVDHEGMQADSVSRRARIDMEQARDDADGAEEALRLLRLQLEQLAEGWTDLRMRLLGEAKAAQERIPFLRRDVERGEVALAEARRAAVDVKEKMVLLRKRDPELWAELASMDRSAGAGETSDHSSGATAAALAAVAGEVERAEKAASSSRGSLADAQAALRHAADTVRAHSGLEMTGEGACHTCGQPVSRNIIHERGEILRVSQTVAEAQLARFERDSKVAERSLELALGKSRLLAELGRLERLHREALVREREAGEELRARRDGLRDVRSGFKAIFGDSMLVGLRVLLTPPAPRHSPRFLFTPTFFSPTIPATQMFAQHELAEAVAREAELQLLSQAKQAERQRLLQAEEVASARVREIEAKADRLERELAKTEEKERDASALKATSIALAEHLGVRGVQNFVFRDAVNQLEANTARYLEALSDGALQLRLSMDGDRVVKRASARAADGGFRDRSLSQLSGGQWRRASLSLELAFVELARQRGRFSCNLLVLDEVLSQLDSRGRERVANMLRALTHGRSADGDSEIGPTHAMYSTILVILQASSEIKAQTRDLPAEELQETFDAIDEVVKHWDSSSVVVDRQLH
ncbi:unnamed protein product [Scytosiphon promiscuus]